MAGGPEDNTPPLAPERAKGARCPLCGRPAQAPTRPFCSRRCADIDLSRWLGGVYAVAAEEPPREED